MKKYVSLLLILTMGISVLAGCGQGTDKEMNNLSVEKSVASESEKTQIKGIQLELSDNKVLIDGVEATNDATQAVHIANDIVYYEEGHDFIYGEGEKEDEHSKEEADAHRNKDDRQQESLFRRTARCSRARLLPLHVFGDQWLRKKETLSFLRYC